MWDLICKFWNNTLTHFFPGSNCFTLPFVHIGPARLKSQANKWFGVKSGQILPSPCEVRFANFEKRLYGLKLSNDKPKRDFGSKLSQIFTSAWDQSWEIWKTPLRICFRDQLLDCANSISNQPNPNDKPKCVFCAISLTLLHHYRGKGFFTLWSMFNT